MVREMMQRIPSADQALEAVGLRHRRANGSASLIGMFALGLAVGAGLALVLAPVSSSLSRAGSEGETPESARTRGT